MEYPHRAVPKVGMKWNFRAGLELERKWNFRAWLELGRKWNVQAGLGDILKCLGLKYCHTGGEAAKTMEISELEGGQDTIQKN